jgi:uncharacterized RDD family membrane protein YckC
MVGVQDHPRGAAVHRRAAAFAFDYLWIVGWLAIVVVGGIGVRQLAPGLAVSVFADPVRGQLVAFGMVTLPISAVFAMAEAAPRGATWGKRRLGLRVEGLDGRAIGIGRSALRTALKFLPWELSHAAIWRFTIPGSVPESVPVGLLAIAWTLVGVNLVAALAGSRRTLYDRLSGTRVVPA